MLPDAGRMEGRMKTIFNRLGDYALGFIVLALLASGVQRTFDTEAPLPYADYVQR